jgi:uncharacterized membrane protein
MISVMFEEIKSLITSVDKKIYERIGTQGSFLPNTPSQNSGEEREPSPLEKSIEQIPLYLSGIQKRLNQISETNIESEKHVLSVIEDLKRRIDNSSKDANTRHYHVVDLKSSKVMVTFIVLFFVLLGSLAGNIYQIQEINRMNDNDIKYRYIKTTNGISSENLLKLENVFYYNRDKKMINKIRNEVEDDERKIRESAEKIERDRLKE